ncbi:ArnT family glycosyltransferase [Caenimonas terrae]|uniref:ArnT family glycosyltransferase n=1 Tax=Caenimonas terrae TaxID=696074 RepID=A0ABW0NA46_9BURK
MDTRIAVPAPDDAPAPARARVAGTLPVAAIAGLVVLWLAATAWLRPLMLPDEGRYVSVAWSMLRSGDWLTPTLNGLPFFHKPPLFYWITAASMAVFGPSEWAARAAPLIGSTLAAMSMYLFLRRWSSERAARVALLALLAQPLFYVGGQFANLDMLVAGCITATIALAAHSCLSFEQGLPRGGALAGAYAMAAAGVLAKGLIGAVLPALVLLAWLLARRRWRTMGSLLSLPGLALFLLICGPWFVAMQARFDGFLNYFFVVQHFQRFAAGGFNNVQPFWFYPVLLLLFGLPWLPWLARSLARQAAGPDDDGALRLLLVLWAALVVGFFSLPQSKLAGYVLPAIPPLAALVAVGLLKRGDPSRRELRWWHAAVATGALVSVGIVVAVTLLPQNSMRGLSASLVAQRAPQDPIFMLGKMYYDVPVYAGLSEPVHVVEDWKSADATVQDNGRKELADAGQFAPELAARLLVNEAALPAALCAARTSWVIGPVKAAEQFPFLAAARVGYAASDATLWRVDSTSPAVANALECYRSRRREAATPAQ